MDRDLPEGVIDADPPGGWDEVNDGETAEQSAQATGSPDLVTRDDTAAGLLSDAALQPDDPVEGELARQSADPDMSPDRGEEP